MGSLMAGWSSLIIDGHKARALRNSSLTKEEINKFWKSRKRTDGEGGDFSFSLVFPIDEERRKAASPFSPHIVESVDQMTSKPDKADDWWTKSNSAFLNEPPHDDTNGAAHKYTPQFEVARLATRTD